MGDLLARIWFVFVQNLLVASLLGTTYNDKCIRSILLMERRTEPEHPAPALILGRGTNANVTTMFSHEALMDEQNKYALIQVAKLITVPAHSESLVVVVTSKISSDGHRNDEDGKDNTTDISMQGIHTV